MSACTNCGTPLTSPTTFCPQCGAPVPDGATADPQVATAPTADDGTGSAGAWSQPAASSPAASYGASSAAYDASAGYQDTMEPTAIIFPIILAVPLFFCCQPGAIAALIMAILGLVTAQGGDGEKGRMFVKISYIISGACWGIGLFLYGSLFCLGILSGVLESM